MEGEFNRSGVKEKGPKTGGSFFCCEEFLYHRPINRQELLFSKDALEVKVIATGVLFKEKKIMVTISFKNTGEKDTKITFEHGENIEKLVLPGRLAPAMYSSQSFELSVGNEQSRGVYICWEVKDQEVS